MERLRLLAAGLCALTTLVPTATRADNIWDVTNARANARAGGSEYDRELLAPLGLRERDAERVLPADQARRKQWRLSLVPTAYAPRSGQQVVHRLSRSRADLAGQPKRDPAT